MVSLGYIRLLKTLLNADYAICGENKPQQGENRNQKSTILSFSRKNCRKTRVLRGFKGIIKTETEPENNEKVDLVPTI